MRTLLLILIAVTLSGCQSPKPSLSLKEARFAEGPVLVQRGEHFYLRYRRALNGNRYPLRAVLIVCPAPESHPFHARRAAARHFVGMIEF